MLSQDYQTRSQLQHNEILALGDPTMHCEKHQSKRYLLDLDLFEIEYQLDDHQCLQCQTKEIFHRLALDSKDL